jgi:hypothetical protein
MPKRQQRSSSFDLVDLPDPFPNTHDIELRFDDIRRVLILFGLPETLSIRQAAIKMIQEQSNFSVCDDLIQGSAKLPLWPPGSDAWTLNNSSRSSLPLSFSFGRPYLSDIYRY